MFKVKEIKTQKIIQVLDAYCDEYGKAWFLIWENDGWRWRPAESYVPPNYGPKYRWVVAGSRDFQNYPLLCKELDKIHDSISEIVCGEARGADTLGRTYAYDNGIKVASFPANWSRWGNSAGFIRNSEMAEYADKAIVFWNGTSPGTRDMIDKMEQREKECIVVNYMKGEV